MHKAIIVIGHGSRSQEANAQFLAVVDQLQQQYPDAQVLAAYLEMVSPSLPEAMMSAVVHGAREIAIIPCLLFTGVHVHKDIPRLIADFIAAHPDIAIRLGRAIGADPLLAAILSARVDELG